MNDAVKERFFAKTKLADSPRPGMTTPCLEWQACCTRGYGAFSFSGKLVKAHRVAWELEHGSIPDGLDVLHKCDNRPCVNVEHLFLGTDADNAADRDAKGRQASGDRNGARLYPGSRRGEKNGHAKLTEAAVIRIFQLRREGWTKTRLASEFGVTTTLVHYVLTRKRWSHVQTGVAT